MSSDVKPLSLPPSVDDPLNCVVYIIKLPDRPGPLLELHQTTLCDEGATGYQTFVPIALRLDGLLQDAQMLPETLTWTSSPCSMAHIP